MEGESNGRMEGGGVEWNDGGRGSEGGGRVWCDGGGEAVVGTHISSPRFHW